MPDPSNHPSFYDDAIDEYDDARGDDECVCLDFHLGWTRLDDDDCGCWCHDDA